MFFGIDVCSYQGDIDWRKVVKAGCQFAILKCIRKDLDYDTAFARNVTGCKAQGIPVSAYTYVYERTVSGAQARAKAAVTACKAQGLKKCVIWWDVEDKSIRKSGTENRAQLTKSILAAREIIERAGFGFGIYCDTDFYTACLNANQIGGKWWIAKYGGNPVTSFGSKPAPKKPIIANEMCGWQYCSKGRISGIKGSVDLNIAYDEDFTSYTLKKEKGGTGNPYAAPDVTVTSDKQARKKGIVNYISSGEGVKFVQWELWRLGYDLGEAGVDGHAGDKTEAAIEAFQHDEFLTVDGLAGPMTVAKLIATASVDYKATVVKGAKTCYPLCIGKVHSGVNASKVNSLATLKKYNALSCNRETSIAMQIADLLASGVVVSHTKKASGKKCVDDAVTGWKYLRHCKVVWVNKPFKELPKEYQQAGCVYYQNSNACVSMGNGHIFSCNKSKGYKYKRKSDYDRIDGYPFTSSILVVIVPLTARK